MRVVVAKHYGSAGTAWPNGSYWMAEFVRPSGARLFWMDDFERSGRTGWAYTLAFAAGFNSREDAEAAFKSRGQIPGGEGEVEFCNHVWADT